MDTQKIIARLGGTAKTAELCQVTPGAVSQWIHSGIPEARLMFLKLARPDVFENLPEAVEPADRPRRHLPDGKNLMSLSTDQPATFEVKK